MDDHFLLMFSEVTPFDTRTEIIGPSKPAAFTASKQACSKKKKKKEMFGYSFNQEQDDDEYCRRESVYIYTY